MSNAYHVLYRMPFHTRSETPPPLEMLAEELVSSGLLRINADNARNFITYSGSDFDLSFSRREMTDPHKLRQTRTIIARTLPGAAGSQGVEEVYQRLLNNFRRTGDISYETELQIARWLVQTAHPVIIQLCLLEQVSIFVSYSHNVADLMAIHFWESRGHNGGMQSVSGDGSAVYVSCGGNPFIEKEEQKTYTTDGFPALARMMVIAAQEFGHYADLWRDEHGMPAGRYSAQLWPLQAHDSVRRARLADRQQVNQLIKMAREMGIYTLAERERNYAFYRQRRGLTLATLWQWWRMWRLKSRIRKHPSSLMEQFPLKLGHNPYWGSNIVECLRDMAFNLSPDADAYRRENPIEEEAILCIEALARVPQQVIKWGEAITRLCWPNLTSIYYDQVIPGCIDAYEKLSGKQFYFPEVKNSAR